MLESKKITTENIGELLLENGVKPSVQRITILRYLIMEKNHPSVDVIYNAIHKEIPTLSRTTVYNTMNLLVEKGIVTALTIKEGELVYDYIETAHAHLHCNQCGMIKDIMLNENIIDMKSLNGFEISEAQINFKGTCLDCIQKN